MKRIPAVVGLVLVCATVAQVQDLGLEKQRFGDVGTAPQKREASDLIVGFITKCLVLQNLLPPDGNLSPNHPVAQVENFLRDYQGLNSSAHQALLRDRKYYFNFGATFIQAGFRWILRINEGVHAAEIRWL